MRDRKKLAAFLDLLLLLGVFLGAWTLRFVGAAQVGTVTMAAVVLVGLLLLWRRGVSWNEIGLVPPRRKDVPVAFQAAAVVGAAYLLTPLLIWALGPLSSSSAIEQQPQSALGFVVDIVVFTWIGAGLGEELAFRGIILHRLRELFGTTARSDVAAAGVQAVWFGLAHPSQGAAGMALTGVMGFGLALFFLRRAEGSLAPLILAHAAVNTVVLTINYFGSGSV